MTPAEFFFLVSDHTKFRNTGLNIKLNYEYRINANSYFIEVSVKAKDKATFRNICGWPASLVPQRNAINAKTWVFYLFRGVGLSFVSKHHFLFKFRLLNALLRQEDLLPWFLIKRPNVILPTHPRLLQGDKLVYIHKQIAQKHFIRKSNMWILNTINLFKLQIFGQFLMC